MVAYGNLPHLAPWGTADRPPISVHINPARAIGEEARLGSLEIGKQADISVLDIVDGSWVVYDVLGNGRSSERAVVPTLSVKRGAVYEAGWGPRPWGWEPDAAC